MSRKKSHNKRKAAAGQPPSRTGQDTGGKEKHFAASSTKSASARSAALPKTFDRWWTQGWMQAGLLALTIIATYGHTLDVPFYFDDYASIVDNPAICDSSNFNKVWRFAPLRVVGYLSFALNYEWHQFQVQGYHAVNILIHLLAAIAVLAFSKGAVRAPALAEKIPPLAAAWLPLLAAMLFALHPLQTQAVTYTVQRLASMAALFYIASLACYLQARLAADKRRMGLTAASLLFALLAFFTKQNTVTLPAAVLITEMIFFPAHRKQLAIISGALLLGLAAMWAALSCILHYDPFSLKAMQALTRETAAISREEYLLTQTRVLWIYIKLFFLPQGLHLDYDIPLATGFFDGRVLAALAGHLAFLGGAALLCRRFPIAAFGVLFYYLAHLVESSVIPIRDVCFEHRTYLPNLGLCLAVAWPAALFMEKIGKKRGATLVPVFLLLILGSMTWQRNQVWRDPVRFWRECATYSPQKVRPWSQLGKHLLRAGRDAEAAEALQKSAALLSASGNSEEIELSETASINLIILLRRQQKYDEALKLADTILKSPISRLNRSKVLANKGSVYLARRQHDLAEAHYRLALRAFPDNLAAIVNLGNALALQGNIHEAKTMYRKALEKDPQNRDARHNLARLGDSKAPNP